MSEASLEKKIRRTDYILIMYQLRFEEEVVLPAYALMRLRRELRRIVKDFPGDSTQQAEWRNLLQPELPTDPVVLRRAQQPAPGFVLRIESLQAHSYAAGDLLNLPVCFFSRGMFLVEPFTRLLETLGPIGIHNKMGRFHLESIEDNYEVSENKQLWAGGPFQIAPYLGDLTQILDDLPPESAKFQFLTPARVLKNSRPLFRPDFAEIFPFVLRRVTGMLAVWADLEDLFDVDYLCDSVTKITESENNLRWQDWRPLQNNEEVGGLCGSVVLSGEELGNFWTVLRIGELFGVGKGAAFGAGRFRLI